MSQGHYEKKHQGNRLLSWSHGSRLRHAVQVILETPDCRLLDYGCGDGVLERRLAEEPRWNGTSLGVDTDASQIRDCQKRLEHLPRTTFADMDVLAEAKPFDMVVCLEVLEHVPAATEALQELNRLLAPNGRLLISVPVETGLVLLGKQAVRFRLGGDYRFTERYSASEMIHALLPTTKTLERPVYKNANGTLYHGHKLFNWRWLRERLREMFVVEEFGTPLRWPCSQKWFLCRKPTSQAG